jgi:hypothetical protein
VSAHGEPVRSQVHLILLMRDAALCWRSWRNQPWPTRRRFNSR